MCSLAMTVSSPGSLSLLIAPSGQLSGDGQLLELMREWQRRNGDQADLWFLPGHLSVC